MSPPAAQAGGGRSVGDQRDAGLSGQIDALLAGMQDSAATLAADQTSQRVEEQLAGGAEEDGAGETSPGQTPLNPSEIESLASQIDALVSEVGATTESSAEGADPVSRSPAAVPHAGASDAPLSEPALGASVDLRALDEQLAVQAREPEPAPRAAPAPVAAVLPDVTDSAERDAALAAAGGAAPALAAPVAVVPAVVDVIEPKVSAGAQGKRLLAWVGRTLRSMVGLSLVLSARTLEASPKLARDTMGWIGLVTVFFACCMWAIILFFRSTPAPEVYGVASDVLEPGEPTPQGRPRPQVHKEEAGHGEADAHAAEADSHGGGGGGGHGAPADDGHGGGH